MNEGDINQYVQKLINYDIYKNQKPIAKTSKRLNDALLKKESYEINMKKQDILLKAVSQENESINETIKEQLQKLEEQKIEKIRLRQQLKTSAKKLYLLSNQDFNLPPEERESAFRNRLCLTLIRMSTRVYIDPSTPAHILRGFAAQEFNEDLLPFELDTRRLPAEEVKRNLWEISSHTSRNSSDWEKLFAV